MKASIKKLVKIVLPGPILVWLRTMRLEREVAAHDQKFEEKPAKDIFSTIFRDKLWGGEHMDFNSGHGSHLEKHVQPYVQSVSSFLKEFSVPPIVVDLGCGDFNIGSQLCRYAGKYIACDVVPELIERNKALYGELNAEFRVVDLIEDPLPVGNVLIVRQVLQHLSNSAIVKALDKFIAFDYLLLTEFVPSGPFTPNIDQPTGPYSRLARGIYSGIELTAPPFSLTCKSEKRLCRTEEQKGYLDVTLYEF